MKDVLDMSLLYAVTNNDLTLTSTLLAKGAEIKEFYFYNITAAVAANQDLYNLFVTMQRRGKHIGIIRGYSLYTDALYFAISAGTAEMLALLAKHVIEKQPTFISTHHLKTAQNMGRLAFLHTPDEAFALHLKQCQQNVENQILFATIQRSRTQLETYQIKIDGDSEKINYLNHVIEGIFKHAMKLEQSSKWYTINKKAKCHKILTQLKLLKEHFEKNPDALLNTKGDILNVYLNKAVSIDNLTEILQEKRYFNPFVESTDSWKKTKARAYKSKYHNGFFFHPSKPIANSQPTSTLVYGN